MIIRIFQVVTHPGMEEAFGQFFHETAIPMMRNTEGVISVLPGAPRPETPREFSIVMVWRDLEALKAFVGEDYRDPHIDPAEADLVEFRSIRHYDSVEG
ncbi:antibiotic biosynthesis monooxygenase family protein [Shimia abyssi]|uniref:Quinol monooxygenase YgiN n=1 Tax=Shimia abyssi TaxID=1662395 RepID=A0A2P8F9B6_9RHOB|nr:antibiotic biosynthesis monooxygenase [Shimia abyssi]PSL18310.1 quinol monooxygenase YgiN [Shimia abyssi]